VNGSGVLTQNCRAIWLPQICPPLRLRVSAVNPPTPPGEVVRPSQFQPASAFVHPRKTTLARCARSDVSSRCTPLACSTTWRRATRVRPSIDERHGRTRTPALMLAPFAPSHRAASWDLRTSRSAALSLHTRADNVSPRSSVADAYNPSCRSTVSGARVSALRNLVASLLAGNGRFAPRHLRNHVAGASCLKCKSPCLSYAPV
jgi:hypothetical protein